MQGKFILELLNIPNSKISVGNRWLIRYESFNNTKLFEVYEHKKYQRYVRLLINTEDEEKACKVLKGEQT